MTVNYKPKKAQCELGVESDSWINSDGCLMFRDRICVPRNDELIQRILREAHSGCLSVHPGSTKLYNDLKQRYRWSCLLQPIMAPKWKWDRITMDFVMGLPLTPSKKDVVWVVVDRLTKSAHFIPLRVDYSLGNLANLYVSEILRLHEVPLSIISVRGSRFTSRFWKKLREALGTKLRFSTDFHPQADGQLERLIQVLEDMLRCCVLKFQEMKDKVKVIRVCLKAASKRQKSYLDLKRKEIEYQVGDRVFLKVSPWRKVLRFGRKGKLSPHFIVPYVITEWVGPVAYRLALPSELEKIQDVFHVSMFRRYRSDPSHVITLIEVEIQPSMTYGEEPIKILAREVKQLRIKSIALVNVLWQRHGLEEATWELEEIMRNQYPNLFACKIITA
ncbi:reverse transcriptase [Gossypium australe]|uniref:Reverse transcriptase n=1 Tax=Gossypium australe TaxID=47621 RepID=A0A5B6VU26_9ROSI|nr:reverse transcriptase [Gossypium australe]